MNWTKIAAMCETATFTNYKGDIEQGEFDIRNDCNLKREDRRGYSYEQ